MMRKAYTSDDGRYMHYYMNQAGGELPGFIGSSTQYGHGLGGIFRNLFRMAVPLLKKGFNIAKPHLKTAASGFIGDVVTNVRNAVASRQQGNGLMVYRRKALKRAPPGCGRNRIVNKKHKNTTKKRRIVKKKASVSRRRAPNRRSLALTKDIF